MYLIFSLFNIEKTCKCIQNPPKDIIKLDIIAFKLILKLDKDNYFNP